MFRTQILIVFELSHLHAYLTEQFGIKVEYTREGFIPTTNGKPTSNIQIGNYILQLYDKTKPLIFFSKTAQYIYIVWYFRTLCLSLFDRGLIHIIHKTVTDQSFICTEYLDTDPWVRQRQYARYIEMLRGIIERDRYLVGRSTDLYIYLIFIKRILYILKSYCIHAIPMLWEEKILINRFVGSNKYSLKLAISSIDVQLISPSTAKAIALLWLNF